MFEQKPIAFDPTKHQELAIYFCDTWSKLAVRVVEAILKRGLPMKIIHVGVNDKRADTFRRHSEEIVDRNGWDEGIVEVYDDEYRDLYNSVATIMQEYRERYPDVYFEIYIGALRTHFPYNLLHMQTDRFLRDALMEADDIALSIKQVDLDSLPLPPGFKVTFEHVTDHQIEEDENEHSTQAA